MSDFTYPEVGATRDGELPAGYSHVRVRVPLGEGEGVFRNAADALHEFWMHRALPARVDATASRAAPGVGVEVAMGVGPLRLKAPCRIVWAVDETRRSGWAYGTLPGHPASGEEAFLVEWDDEDVVWLTVTAFSRPASRLMRMGGPVVRMMQRAYARRCGAVLRRLAKVR